MGRPRACAGLATISLPDAIRIARERNPDSLSAEEDVASARGALVQSRALPNPSLFVYRIGENLSPADSPVPNQFGVSWTIPIGGKRGAGIAAADADVAAAEGTRGAFRHQLALDVETAFIAVLLDQSLLDFAKQDQLGLHQAMELDELRNKDGKIAYSDVLKLRIQARGDRRHRAPGRALARERPRRARSPARRRRARARLPGRRHARSAAGAADADGRRAAARARSRTAPTIGRSPRASAARTRR